MKRILAGILSAAMLLSTGATAFAADTELVNGEYVADVNMYQEGKVESETLSMCNSLFGTQADITIADGEATIKLYVANPIPAFGDFEEGTINQVTTVVDETTYTATIGVQGADAIYFDTTATMFGIEAGNYYQSDVLTFVLPVEAFEAEWLDVNAYVAAVMENFVDFDFVMSNLTLVNAAETVDVQEVPVTATVLENQTTYTVTVPATLGLGTLSATEDKAVDYAVDVTVNAGNDGRAVQVTSDAEGELAAGNTTIAFANNFGTQTFAQTGTGAGTLSVEAANVAGVASGDYTGTINFAISMVEAN